jgi:hypothetical protein
MHANYYYYLFTAIGFAPGDSGPYTTQLQQNTYSYNKIHISTLCTTKIKRLKFSESHTGSDVSVQLAS